MSPMEAHQELRHLVLMVSTGGIEDDFAKAKALPLLEIINKRGKEIAKKHGKSYKPLTWGFAVRYGVK